MFNQCKDERKVKQKPYKQCVTHSCATNARMNVESNITIEVVCDTSCATSAFCARMNVKSSTTYRNAK